MKKLACCIAVMGFAIGSSSEPAHAQEAGRAVAGTAEINLRKSIGQREYQGRQISGEERQIARGDSLWRILIEEKGVPERRFRSYLVLIKGLNPQLKNLDALRVGDKIFIPLPLEEGEKGSPRGERASAAAPTTVAGDTVNYQVKPGEHLYRILRERYNLSDERQIAQYASLVKDLNPERKNWDTLTGGEVIRLPLRGPLDVVKDDTGGAVAGSAASQPSQSDRSQAQPAVVKPAEVQRLLNAAARENIDLLLQVARAIGNQAESSGEEVVNLPEGAVRLDRAAFPVVVNPGLRQRVVIDRDGKIPASLKSQLNDPRVGTPVVAVSGNVNVAEAVRQLLAGLGYQSLPNDRPVVAQDGGVAVEARGQWIFLAPAVSNRPQEVVVVNLTERPGEIPEYLTGALAMQGLYLRDIVIGGAEPRLILASAPNQLKSSGPPRELPKHKRDFVDALLLSFRIPFGVADTISVDLGGGLRIDTLVDRVFEIEGKRTALLFRRVDPMIRKALLERHATNAIEIEVNALSSREIIARILQLLGDRGVYGEHRFAAANGSAKDRVTLKAWGFNLPERSIFLTDRPIPTSLHRFFFEKGLDIVYFQ